MIPSSACQKWGSDQPDPKGKPTTGRQVLHHAWGHDLSRVHADGNFVPEQNAGECTTGELAALIRIEDFRFALPLERLFQSLHATIGVHCYPYAMGVNPRLNQSTMTTR